MKLKIAYFYPKLLNLYGDNGNVEILVYRAFKRGIETEVIPFDIDTPMDDQRLSACNLLFMGGGPDSSQLGLYEDLISQKAPYIKDYVENGGVSLLICGAYQLFGNYYKSADGSIIEGLGIFDLYTEHFGNHKPRCIGNLSFQLNYRISENIHFPTKQPLQDIIVGFENHGGRTYLGENVNPLGIVKKGLGNNGEDLTEGAIYQNSYGTYSHGPILSKNPHFADYLIARALNVNELTLLDDSVIYQAHLRARELN